MSAPRQPTRSTETPQATPHESVDWSEASLVVAHPDDEVLFFSSVVRRVKRVLICFGDNPLSPAHRERRRRALSEHPLPSVRWLDLLETGCVGMTDWRNPVETPVGIQLAAGPRLRAAYARSYQRLLERLRGELAGAPLVVTHNPWGEYGHEEHAQVCRVVRDLKRDLGFDLLHDDYCGSHNVRVALRYAGRIDTLAGRIPTDADLAREVLETYKRNECWTWFDDYQWPSDEGFLRIGDDSRTAARPTRLTVIDNCMPMRPAAGLRGLLSKLGGARSPAAQST